jgi:AmmeMemoRadiSam system protein B
MPPVVFGAVFPHPPILVPQVAGGRLKEVSKSRKSIEKDIDTIVVITPHGEVGQAAVPIYTSHVFEGHFGFFGAGKPVYKFKGDPELGNAIVKEALGTKVGVAPIADSFLDHGALVPLHYIHEAGVRKPILPIAVAIVKLDELYEFGKLLTQAAEKLGRKIAVIASADMSHRLSADSPGGFDGSGAKFDEKLVELVRNYDVNGILKFDPALAERAGQDSLWSISMLLGALDGASVQQEVLSYEGPLGVGYMIACFKVKQ